MDKLIRKLRRELTRNPKKTAILAGGLLLAVYFWAPLISKWASPNKPSKSKSHANQPVRTRKSVESSAPVESAAIHRDWQELANRIESDPLRSIAGLTVPGRDPFFAKIQQRVEPGAIRTVIASSPQEIAPAMLVNLDLKLEAVIVRGRRRAAIINGVIYREHETFTVTAPRTGGAGREPPARSAADGLPLEVTVIEADHVVVAWGTETRRLELERPTLAPGDQIVPISASH